MNNPDPPTFVAQIEVFSRIEKFKPCASCVY